MKGSIHEHQIRCFHTIINQHQFFIACCAYYDGEQKQIGADKWPFTREEVMLECRSNGALMVINPATLMQYPINDIAIQQMKNREINAMPIDILLLDDPQQSGMKMDIAVIQQAAQSLCHND